MGISTLVVLVQMLIIQCSLQEVSTQSNYGTLTTSNRSINLFISSKKGEDGEWVTMFHASKSDSITTNITMDLMQSVHYVDQNEEVHIKGLIRADGGNVSTNRLRFHPNCGKNAAISNDGRSVEKIILDDALNGVVLTHRPLRRNELLEVRLDKKHNKFSYCLGIGVTINSPESFSVPDHMHNLKSGNWMMYHTNIYINGADSVKGYGKNLNDLQVGDRIGVMVNNFGALHFFVNGVDQGPAASNMPLTLHGVFELYYNAAKGTIVD